MLLSVTAKLAVVASGLAASPPSLHSPRVSHFEKASHVKEGSASSAENHITQGRLCDLDGERGPPLRGRCRGTGNG